ncbi:MAG: transglutaminase domain-containing protein [Muricomes sp.]
MKGVLQKNKGVSEGYAKAFAALGMAAGLDCVYVTGENASGDSCAWNYVKIDGQWKVVDAAKNDAGDSKNTEEYFNLALDNPLYTESHYPDAEFSHFPL